MRTASGRGRRATPRLSTTSCEVVPLLVNDNACVVHARIIQTSNRQRAGVDGARGPRDGGGDARAVPLAHRGVRRGEAVRRGRERRGRVGVVVVVVVARSSPFPDGRRGRRTETGRWCARWRRWASWRSRSPSCAGAGCDAAATATRWSGAGRSGSGTSTARWASTCLGQRDARRLARRELERAELERAEEAAAAAGGMGTGRGGSLEMSEIGGAGASASPTQVRVVDMPSEDERADGNLRGRRG